jgi:transcriptional regulatory protein LEU3
MSNANRSLDAFQLSCARIHILAFLFFTNPENPDYESLSRLYSLCVSTLRLVNNLSQSVNNFTTTCLSFVDRTVTLAGFCILKLVRSPLAQHLDLLAGEQAYFYAVQFTKSMSLQSNDLPARAAAIMTNLWNSSKVFRKKDGTVESLGLRLRTRLSMSVSFDLFWYWREEFGHISNPYNGEESVHHHTAQTATGSPRK